MSSDPVGDVGILLLLFILLMAGTGLPHAWVTWPITLKTVVIKLHCRKTQSVDETKKKLVFWKENKKQTKLTNTYSVWLRLDRQMRWERNLPARHCVPPNTNRGLHDLKRLRIHRVQRWHHFHLGRWTCTTQCIFQTDPALVSRWLSLRFWQLYG